MDKELLLVKLPGISGIDQEFFGIGYYSDHGFIFLLLTEDLIHARPLRSFPFPNDIGYNSEHEFEILGRIKNLKDY